MFVLSPDFCNSEWVEVERTSSIADDPSGLKRKVRPLMLHACHRLPTFPRFLRQVQAIDLASRHALDVAATFQLSWDVTSDPAKQVLRVMGELAPAAVPRTLLRAILNFPEQPALRDELGKSISELIRLSLVELDSSGDPLAHRLILAFARHRNVVDHASPFNRCREALQQAMGRAHGNPDASTSRELEGLVPHVEFLTLMDGVSPEDCSSLLSAAGTQHRTMGRFTAARRVFFQALASNEKSFEPGHPPSPSASRIWHWC